MIALRFALAHPYIAALIVRIVIRQEFRNRDAERLWLRMDQLAPGYREFYETKRAGRAA